MSKNTEKAESMAQADHSTVTGAALLARLLDLQEDLALLKAKRKPKKK